MALRKNTCALFQYFKNVNCKYFTAKLSDRPVFPGAKTINWTENLEFVGSHSYDPLPVYRVLDSRGRIIDHNHDPKLDIAMLQKMYKNMNLLNVTDTFLNDAQSKGRITFYLTNHGEEASHIGSAAALNAKDVIYGQYRETGVLIWRGYSLESLINQIFGNVNDKGKGKEMPVHYGDKNLNFVTISSTLATQLPQAVGSAYALKGQDRVVVGYFGEGAASEGDAHAAFNFAATLDCPVLFFCRNNGYAISTPSHEQYRGDGIAVRGPSYGINTLRVDGNDLFAVYNATKKAREYAIKECKPVLIEALSYRVGAHSTNVGSDDYRSKEEINEWVENHNPIKIFRLYLESNKMWNEEMEKEWISECKKNILAVFEKSEKLMKPRWMEMFTDVYAEMPQHLKEQMMKMEKHVEQYQDKYPINDFVK